MEGKEDANFIEILSKNAIVQSFTIDKIGGSNQELLIKKLESIKNGLELEPINRFGIILDLDDFTNNDRLEFINTCFENSFGQKLLKINEFEKFEIKGLEIEIACFFIEQNLDVLAKNISKIYSKKADCLFKCLENEEVKKKERDKAWTYYYMLWDVCNKKDREKRSENVTFKYTNSKNAWDLESTELKDLKLFLNQFD